MRNTSLVALLCLSATVGIAQSPPATEPPIAFINASVVSPGHQSDSSGTTVLVEGGQISGIFATGSRPLPPDTRIHDLEGRFLIPGLIDAHKHLTGIFHRESPERMHHVLERMFRSGIVAMRDMAGDARLVGHIADRAAAGEIPAPEIYYVAVIGSPHFAHADPRMERAGRGFLRGEAAWAQAVTSSRRSTCRFRSSPRIGAYSRPHPRWRCIPLDFSINPAKADLGNSLRRADPRDDHRERRARLARVGPSARNAEPK